MPVPASHVSPVAKGEAYEVVKAPASANVAITTYPKDILGWSLWPYLSPVERGHVMTLYLVAAAEGGIMADEHPAIEAALRDAPGVLAKMASRSGACGIWVFDCHPFDVVRKLQDRERFVKAGRASGEARRAKADEGRHTAVHDGDEVDSPSERRSIDVPTVARTRGKGTGVGVGVGAGVALREEEHYVESIRADPPQEAVLGAESRR